MLAVLQHWFYVLRSHLVMGTRRLYRRLGGKVKPRVNQITEQLYLGGFFDLHDWQILHAQGVRVVVNLQSERQDRFGDLGNEGYLWLPTMDRQAPSAEALQQGVAFVQQAIQTDHKVLIHCHAGMSRSATLCTAVLIAQGMDLESAWNLVKARRPIVHLHPWQRRALEQFARDWAQQGAEL
ncbi:MAG: dual specificity protein phosphatase family protein [Chloroflexi bacterium]|nr:dual specificity protein phosphatase family protein [Chloroflexota bacterium]